MLLSILQEKYVQIDEDRISKVMKSLENRRAPDSVRKNTVRTIKERKNY